MTKEKIKKSKNLKTVKKYKQNSSDPKCIFGKVFANWCGACKGLKPEWIKMIKQLQNKDPVVSEKEMNLDESTTSIIIKKDGIVLEILQILDSDFENIKKSRSELSDFEANGYPTIFRKMENSPIEYYQGARSPEDMINWAISKKGPIIGGEYSKKIHKKTQKKSRIPFKSRFSQSISNFWGWK